MNEPVKHKRSRRDKNVKQTVRYYRSTTRKVIKQDIAKEQFLANLDKV